MESDLVSWRGFPNFDELRRWCCSATDEITIGIEYRLWKSGNHVALREKSGEDGQNDFVGKHSDPSCWDDSS